MALINHRLFAGVTYLLLLVAAVAAGNSVSLQGKKPAPVPPADSGPPVVIDPGHGGIDGGATIGSVMEKDINLDVAIKIADLLGEKGIPAVLTRREDVHFNLDSYREDLQRRLDVPAADNAWALVAVHANASGNPRARGFLVLYQEDSEESRLMARLIRESLASFRPDYPAVADVEINHYYMDNSPCPTVIVEVGYLTNSGDRASLAREEYRLEVARAIARGIEAARSSFP